MNHISYPDERDFIIECFIHRMFKVEIWIHALRWDRPSPVCYSPLHSCLSHTLPYLCYLPNSLSNWILPFELRGTVWNRSFEDTKQNRLYANVRTSSFLCLHCYLRNKTEKTHNRAAELISADRSQGPIEYRYNTQLDRQLSIDVLFQKFLQRCCFFYFRLKPKGHWMGKMWNTRGPLLLNS